MLVAARVESQQQPSLASSTLCCRPDALAALVLQSALPMSSACGDGGVTDNKYRCRDTLKAVLHCRRPTCGVPVAVLSTAGSPLPFAPALHPSFTAPRRLTLWGCLRCSHTLGTMDELRDTLRDEHSCLMQARTPPPAAKHMQRSSCVTGVCVRTVAHSALHAEATVARWLILCMWPPSRHPH